MLEHPLCIRVAGVLFFLFFCCALLVGRLNEVGGTTWYLENFGVETFRLFIVLATLWNSNFLLSMLFAAF
jgi:hypothetical protein